MALLAHCFASWCILQFGSCSLEGWGGRYCMWSCYDVANAVNLINEPTIWGFESNPFMVILAEFTFTIGFTTNRWSYITIIPLVMLLSLLRGDYPSHTPQLLGAPSHFPLEEILRAILMAWTWGPVRPSASQSGCIDLYCLACLAVYLSIYLPIYQSIYPSIINYHNLSIVLSIFLHMSSRIRLVEINAMNWIH